MTKLITKEGMQKIKDELDDRKIRVRRKIASAIKEAKEQGDLSENAEYAEAKRQQNENETRIAQLGLALKESRVFTKKKNNGEVQMGSKVKVQFDKTEMKFQIVSSNEIDPENFKISNESPMGKAFMGRKKEEKVEVSTPHGKVNYKILEVN